MHADAVATLVPYFRAVSRRLARGADADDLLSIAVLSVFLRLDAINRHPDPRFAAKRCGVWAMLADRKRQRDRAARLASIEGVDVATHDDRDDFADLLQLAGEDADLLRRRFGVGQSLREITQSTGLAAQTIRRRLARGTARIRKAIR